MMMPKQSTVKIHYGIDGKLLFLSIDGYNVTGIRSVVIRDNMDTGMELALQMFANVEIIREKP